MYRVIFILLVCVIIILGVHSTPSQTDNQHSHVEMNDDGEYILRYHGLIEDDATPPPLLRATARYVFVPPEEEEEGQEEDVVLQDEPRRRLLGIRSICPRRRPTTTPPTGPPTTIVISNPNNTITTQPPTTTQVPTTVAPTTPVPTTPIPTTITPTTPVPTTEAPTTPVPTTLTPTTPVPTTVAPTTQTPTTVAPTTPTPTLTPTIAPPLAASTNPITYHTNGRVVLGTLKVYYIFYGNWSVLDPVALQLIPEFTTHLGGTPEWNIQTTYYQTSSTTGVRSYLNNSLEYKGYVIDNSYAYGTQLSDSAFYYIVRDAIVGGSLPVNDDNTAYLVLITPDVYATSGLCTAYCGWHTYSTINRKKVWYGMVGSPTRCGNSCLARPGSPNTILPNFNAINADSMISIVYHELAEIATDPDFSAWYDRDYFENADRCAWQYGYTWTTPNGASANARIGNRDYLLQMNWVNAHGGYCVNRWD